MLQAFTRNYQDNSTDAGFQFTFYCDVCNDGYKSSFIESETYKKKKASRLFGQSASVIGSAIGGAVGRAGNTASQSSNVLSERFENKTPEWHKEHENAFVKAQNEAKEHFHRCPSCNQYSCDQCWNEDATLCTKCAPRTEVYVAKVHADATRRNIDEAGKDAKVWEGKIESKTTMCPTCGKPAGSGKFCNNCGANLELKTCPKCGAKNAQSVRFCNNCGENLQQTSAPAGKCSACGQANPPGTKFCGGCGNKLS
ncbi:double zinc ribbon [Candidatus Methanoplasma termitum]|uniref:Double zinc ribbon n=1 Tax=Candidatus Methanoplasma termitum TaxID=1577791 RepID=A0A0A7LE11_9ARCH|nr:zinc ribbon domain-containing protein [Candidatus Methanoplasma termitum]AIZ57218.1 double zinc ribbon [Candidatus Methanoplasma termitum]